MMFKGIVKEVKSKTVKDIDGIYSAQFGENAKRNASKVVTLACLRDGFVQDLVKILCAKIRKQLKILSGMENKKATSNLKLKDYICFMIKTLEDAVRRVSPDGGLKDLVLSLKNDLFDVICTGAESEDVLVRN